MAKKIYCPAYNGSLIGEPLLFILEVIIACSVKYSCNRKLQPGGKNAGIIHLANVIRSRASIPMSAKMDSRIRENDKLTFDLDFGIVVFG